MSEQYPEPGVRRFVTASVMAATTMNSLDSTIANVALPHIQGSVSASSDEITWVLTSYIVAAAIFTPMTGWLAGRFGRKRLMLVSIIGFTFASGLCGIATNIDELVGFRVLQGVFGAALVPISQAILLDINPPERHGPAMAVWGMGAMLGPIIGPALGGWLTDSLTWRWVFFINLPVGILAFLGLLSFLTETRSTERMRLDFFGFGTLALAIGSFQLMLDRGQTADWFNSEEICIEAGCAIFFAYLFIVHMATAKRPFIDPALFANRNFTLGCLFGFVLGVVLFSVLALQPVMLESLYGYPVVLTGIVSMPRGVGTFLAMAVVGRIIRKVDTRVLMISGLALIGYAMWRLSGFTVQMGWQLIVTTGFIQGIGTGLAFIALTASAFATLDSRFRNDGSAMFTLIRNLGSAVGISSLQAVTMRNAAKAHARLTEYIRPDNPILMHNRPDFDFSSAHAVARMNAEVSAQASMVSYIDSYWLLFVISFLIMPVLLFMRPPRQKDGDQMHVHVD